MTSTLTKNQKKTRRAEFVDDDGKLCVIEVEIRHDDECGNGHNTFSITGTVYDRHERIPGERPIRNSKGESVWPGSSGCIHEEIAKRMPELAPFIKWHLTSTDEPMHYIANAAFHASDRDHNGLRKGEPSRFEYGLKFDDVPITHQLKSTKFWQFLKERVGTGEFQIAEHQHPPDSGNYKFAPKYSFVGYAEKWHECPFDSRIEAEEFAAALKQCRVAFVKIPVEFSEGKERDLDAARSCAVWPDATDDELMADDLKERLAERLPALQAEFQAAVESLGFTF
jgi:hypothetical protein